MKYFESMIGATSSPETKQLTAALSKAQSQFTTIAYDRTNEHLRSKYATFQGCCEALRKPLTDNGFAMQYQVCFMQDQWVMVGVLRHLSGEYVTGTVPLLNHPTIRIDKRTGEVTETPPNMQGLGAAMTYAKRQLLLSLTGAWVGEDDDDGESAKPQGVAGGTDAARAVVDGMVLESRAMGAIERSKDEADKAMSFVKLQVHQGKAPRAVYERLAAAYSNKWGQG